MNKRNPYRAKARSVTMTNADGTTDDVVRIYGGARSLAIDFSELDALIQSLERLRDERHESILEALVTS